MREKPRDNDTKFTTLYTLKPTPIPPGFTLLVDTREQRPLFTRVPKGLTIRSETLKDGDYSVAGFQDGGICFERKSSDIFPYCSVDHDKTKRKMERFKNFEFVGLIIEIKEADLFQFQQMTKVHPEVVRAALISFEVRYGVHCYFGNRENCSRWLLDRAIKFYRIKHEV